MKLIPHYVGQNSPSNTANFFRHLHPFSYSWALPKYHLGEATRLLESGKPSGALAQAGKAAAIVLKQRKKATSVAEGANLSECWGDAKLLEGEAFLSIGKANEAMVAFQSAYERYKDARAHLGRSQLQVKLGDARLWLAKAEWFAGERYDLSLGSLAEAVRNYLGIAGLEKKPEIVERLADAKFWLGKNKAALGAPLEADSSFSEAIELYKTIPKYKENPDVCEKLADAHYEAGMALKAAGKKEGVIAHFAEAQHLYWGLVAKDESVNHSHIEKYADACLDFGCSHLDYGVAYYADWGLKRAIEFYRKLPMNREICDKIDIAKQKLNAAKAKQRKQAAESEPAI